MRRQLLTDLSEESLNVIFFSLSYRLLAILLGLITFFVCLVCFITLFKTISRGVLSMQLIR